MIARAHELATTLKGKWPSATARRPTIMTKQHCPQGGSKAKSESMSATAGTAFQDSLLTVQSLTALGASCARAGNVLSIRNREDEEHSTMSTVSGVSMRPSMHATQRGIERQITDEESQEAKKGGSVSLSINFTGNEEKDAAAVEICRWGELLKKELTGLAAGDAVAAGRQRDQRLQVELCGSEKRGVEIKGWLNQQGYFRNRKCRVIFRHWQPEQISCGAHVMDLVELVIIEGLMYNGEIGVITRFRRNVAYLGLSYAQRILKMTGEQRKSPECLRFYRAHYEIALCRLPDNVQGAGELKQVQSILGTAHGKLLLKCSVWDGQRQGQPGCASAGAVRHGPVAGEPEQSFVGEGACMSSALQSPLGGACAESARSALEGAADSASNARDGCDVSSASTGHFEKLCCVIESLMAVPDEEHDGAGEERARSGKYRLLLEYMSELHEYISDLSRNTANRVWPEIPARIAHQNKTEERQSQLDAQNNNDRVAWGQKLNKILRTLGREKSQLPGKGVVCELRQRACSSVYKSLQMTRENTASVEFHKFVKLFSDLTSLVLCEGKCGSGEIREVQRIIESDIGKLLMKYDVWYSEAVNRINCSALLAAEQALQRLRDEAVVCTIGPIIKVCFLEAVPTSTCHHTEQELAHTPSLQPCNKSLNESIRPAPCTTAPVKETQMSEETRMSEMRTEATACAAEAADGSGKEDRAQDTKPFICPMGSGNVEGSASTRTPIVSPIFDSFLKTANNVVSSQTNKELLTAHYGEMREDIVKIIRFIDLILDARLPSNIFSPPLDSPPGEVRVVCGDDRTSIILPEAEDGNRSLYYNPDVEIQCALIHVQKTLDLAYHSNTPVLCIKHKATHRRSAPKQQQQHF